MSTPQRIQRQRTKGWRMPEPCHADVLLETANRNGIQSC